MNIYWLLANTLISMSISASTVAAAAGHQCGKIKSRQVPSLRLFLCSLLVTFGTPFHYGYQLTLVSPAQPVMVQFVNESLVSHYNVSLNRYGAEAIWGATVASLFAGSIPGAILTRCIVDNIGRKYGIILSNAATALCAMLSSASQFLNSIELFAACRFLLGFFIMIGLGVSSVFLTECSPLQCRGGIGMITGIIIQFGAFIGTIVAMPQLLGQQAYWWLIYLLEAIVLIAVTGPMFTLHESPSFLMFHAELTKAADAVQFYWGCNNDGRSSTDILDEIGTEYSLRSNAAGMVAVWKQKNSIGTRRGLWVGILFGVCMSFCGIAVIDAYIVEILHQTMQFSSFVASLTLTGIQCIGMFAGILASLVVDRIGRRPLLFISLSMTFCANIGISLILYVKQQSLFLNVTLVIFVVLHSCALCCGLLPLSYFVSNEMVDQPSRSAVQGWAKFADSISRSVVLASFLPMRNLIGDGQAYALFFVPLLAFIGVYLHFYLPETKNKNLLEVENELARMAKAKKNKQANTFEEK